MLGCFYCFAPLKTVTTLAWAPQPGHIPRAVRAGHGHGPAGPAVQVHGPGQPCRRRDLQPRRRFWVRTLIVTGLQGTGAGSKV